jgi:hypothetical protein
VATYRFNGSDNTAPLAHTPSVLERIDVTARLERIKRLTDELAVVQQDSQIARLLLSAIRQEVAATRDAIKTLETHPPFTERP